MTRTLKYNDKTYYVSVGYYALKHANREMTESGKGTLSMDNIMGTDLEVLEPLLYYSLVMGHRLEKQELDLAREDMEFVLNECMFQFTGMIPSFFPEPEEGKKLGEGKQDKRR